MVYLIEARWRMATSKAWTESRGTCRRPLTRVSCSRRHDTLASHRMDTLKIRSFPSPGMVTSKSTWRNRGQKSREDDPLARKKQIIRLCSILESLFKKVFSITDGAYFTSLTRVPAYSFITCSWPMSLNRFPFQHMGRSRDKEILPLITLTAFLPRVDEKIEITLKWTY